VTRAHDTRASCSAHFATHTALTRTFARAHSCADVRCNDVENVCCCPARRSAHDGADLARCALPNRERQPQVARPALRTPANTDLPARNGR
jgi:hypothetical protein